MNKPLLAFDTSMGECSVALWHGGAVLASEAESVRNRQTQCLVPMIESVMRRSGIGLEQLALITTTSGPGSFTGIRIGLAVARSLTLALRTPALAVSTLELLAWQACKGRPDIIVSAINAYRGEVYVQSFSYAHTMQPLTPPQSIPHESLPEFTAAYASFIPAGDLEESLTAAEDARRPCASALAEYAAIHSLQAEDYPPQPLYIRPPDAKLPANPLAF